ncbi:hypothetical protein LTR37_008377 [Vermiconidia calcicola]|uniref:Uncharacterized protein n=1 Tax=Vermiconidia calcicola TaxID=1690605 RepID=A0ACC3NDT8_9PEZI|nr:hypothetical protein LTR37_008377 [Vermiconidia calcicola]
MSMRNGRPPRKSSSHGSNSSRRNQAQSSSGSSNGSSSSGSGSGNASPHHPTSDPGQHPKVGVAQMSVPVEWSMPSPAGDSMFPFDSNTFADDAFWSEEAGTSLSSELESLFGTDAQSLPSYNQFLDQAMMSNISTAVSLPPPSEMPPSSAVAQPLIVAPLIAPLPRDASIKRSASMPQPVSHLDTQQQTTPAARSCPSRRRNCMATLFELTLEMDVSDQRCTTATAPSGSALETGVQAQQQSREVDNVLLRNRKAIDTLTKTLACPCSAESSITVAAYLLASKVIAWNGAILGAESDSRLEGEVNIMASYISATPISMGNYRLSPRAQRSVRANVVLAELRNLAQPMIDRMPLFRSSSVTDLGKTGVVAEEDCMLRQQLRRMIAAAKASAERSPSEEHV